jgi:hypothetical protein
MSDFFTRLAERALGLAPTIQPIKPSLFAPDPDAKGEKLIEITKESAGSTGGETFAGTQPTDDLPALHPDTGGILSQEHYAAKFARAPAEQSRPAAPAMRQSTSFTSTEPPGNSASSRGNLHQSAQHGPRQTPKKSFSPDAIHTRGSTQVTGEIEPAVQQSGTRAQSSATTQIRPASHNGSSLLLHSEQGHSSDISDMKLEAVEMSISPASTNEQTLYRHVILGERTRRSAKLPVPISPAQLQLEALTPEPTIQVTIGRVEVRAVTTPATTTHSRQQPVKPPAMSLDEYLRRQEQGGRR